MTSELTKWYLVQRSHTNLLIHSLFWVFPCKHFPSSSGVLRAKGGIYTEGRNGQIGSLTKTAWMSVDTTSPLLVREAVSCTAGSVTNTWHNRRYAEAPLFCMQVAIQLSCIKSPLARSLTNEACSHPMSKVTTFIPSADRISLVEANINYFCWLHTLRKTRIPLARHICARLTCLAEWLRQCLLDAVPCLFVSRMPLPVIVLH